MLVDENKRFLISSFCSSTSNCTLQHCYLCPLRLVANHLLDKIPLTVCSTLLSSLALKYFGVVSLEMAAKITSGNVQNNDSC